MVIQRWQSVFLLIAAVMMACFTFFSLGQVQLPDYSLNFTTMGFYIEGQPTDGAVGGCLVHTWGFFVISLMSIILTLLAIFCFKNFRLQKTLCMIEVTFLVAVAVVGAVYGYWEFEGASVSWSSIIICPLLALIATVLAYRRIKSDERLLKSADRLR